MLGLVLLLSGCENPLKDDSPKVVSSITLSRANVAIWEADKIYVKGNKVSWDNKIYIAGWWTLGEKPGTTGEWGVWKVSQVQEVLDVTLSASSTTVAPGTTITLSWTSEFATELTASGAWSGVKTLQGSESIIVDQTSIYTLNGKDKSGNTLSRTVTVKTEAAVPSISFSASSSVVDKGTATVLTWDSSNIVEVYASGAWSGSKPFSGSETTSSIDTDSIFTLNGKDSNGNVITKSIEIKVNTTPIGDYPKQVGETIILSDATIQSRYNGIESAYLPGAVAGSIQELMSQADYEALFPRRYGSAKWSETSGKTDIDYFSYNNLINALRDMAQFKLRLELKGWSSRVYRLEKNTKKATLLREDSDFSSISREATIHIVDFGKFASEGSLELRKRDLAAFLANIAHETTGGWDTAPDGRFAWGLYFKQEVGHDNSSVGGYTDRNNPVYPYNSSESYHGRGPMQLSWNYNYGYFSQIIYGDKMVLINNPDSLADDGRLGFMAGIWFWMTAQGTKPACHDVMVGNWTPSQADINANRLPGFGVTINVINGGLEAGIPNDYRVRDRIGFFENITSRFSISTGNNVDCYTQQPF